MTKDEDGVVDALEKKLKGEIEEVTIELLDIAGVPPKYHERFCVITADLLEKTYYLRKCKEMGRGSKKIKNIEKAAWDLSNALQALTHEQYVVLRNIGIYFNSETSPDWPAAAQEIVFACSCITGKNPPRAREAACLLSGEAQDGAIGVELLRDIKAAFGDDEVIRSADLVTKLVADPERPWAEWRHGRPLTQKQLAGLLRPFSIISTEVHPPGLSHGKGYRRVDLEPMWETYCPGQNPLRSRFRTSEARKCASVDGMSITCDFSSARKVEPRGSKNGNLSYSHAGLRACADQNPENGVRNESATTEAPSDIHPCAVCDAADPPPNRVAVDGIEVWLHPECERFYDGIPAGLRHIHARIGRE
jgi:Protein of unknown function (DUF3631)